MAYLGSWKIDDLLTFYANTHTPSTSAAVDADAVPGYRIYEDETGTPILTGSMALLDDGNTVGFYSEQITLSAANGLEKGKCYCIRTTGVVAGVTAALLDTFQIEAEVDSNSVSNLNANVITATSIASSAITAAKLDTDAITAAKVAADVTAEIADGVWDEAASGHLTSGSFGQRLNLTRAATAQAGAATSITLDASASAVDDFYNTQLIWISGGTGAGQARVIDDYVGSTKVATVATWATNPDVTSVFVIIPFGTSGTLSVGGIADAVWDELRSGHITSGTYGEGDLQVYGSVGVESSGRLNIHTWLEGSGGEIADATACQMEVCNAAGNVCIANGDWSIAPTETSDNTWYAVKTGGSGSLEPGMVYRVKVTMTYNSISYVRFFAFNAAI